MSSYYRTLLMEQVIDGAYYVNLIIAYANSQGWTIPSTGTINAMIALVDSMLSSGIWNKYDIFYNFGYNDTSLANFARINWKSPGNFTISYNSVTLPTYTTTGFQQTVGSGGVNDYSLNTNFIPSINGVNYTLNNASITRLVSGVFSTPTPNFVLTNWSDISSSSEGCSVTATKAGATFIYRYAINGSILTINEGITLIWPGLITFYLANNNLRTINRVNSTLVSRYINGSLVDTTSSLSTSLSNNSFELLTSEYIGTDKAVFRLFGAGAEMNATDNSNLNTYYNTFKTTIGL